MERFLIFFHMFASIWLHSLNRTEMLEVYRIFEPVFSFYTKMLICLNKSQNERTTKFQLLKIVSFLKSHTVSPVFLDYLNCFARWK